MLEILVILYRNPMSAGGDQELSYLELSNWGVGVDFREFSETRKKGALGLDLANRNIVSNGC